MPLTSAPEEQIAAVRRFSRFYTRTIGTLQEGLLESEFSLAEVRVLYEIVSRDRPTASEIAAALDLDMGYLSRLLRSFSSRKLISRKASAADGRQRFLTLTRAGRKEFTGLDLRSSQQVQQMIQHLDAEGRGLLVSSMAAIESLLSPQAAPMTPLEPCILRSHRAGDIGWVVERHGALYSQEYGWDERFEALVARITADFVDNFDPQRERCWIGDRNGVRLGCVFLVKDTKAVDAARLRLLLVEPSARGLGLGRTLVAECTRFARQAGYGRIILWTNSVLDAARHLYENEGYRLMEEEKHHSFGKDLVGQNWELLL